MVSLIENADGLKRCGWCGDDADYIVYHDQEWGFPVTDEVRLFEKICLEGFQAGLSWLTILRKRENFRAAFANFDFNLVAHFGEQEVLALLANAGIVRHRGKIEACIQNARMALEMKQAFGTLADYFWQYEQPSAVGGDAISSTPVSAALSKDLKKRGWRFVGPTTCYAFMQAMGLVNDHLEGCYVRAQVIEARTRFGQQQNN